MWAGGTTMEKGISPARAILSSRAANTGEGHATPELAASLSPLRQVGLFNTM